MMPSADSERLERERLEADRRYNDALTELDRLVGALSSLPAPGRDDFSRLATALIIFLQQITAFVDTKDRRLAADLAGRIDALAPAIESIAELRTHIAILQRATAMLKRSISRQAPAASPESAVGRVLLDPPTGDDYKYVGFEDQFRGSDDEIRARLSAYVPLFANASDVVDVGCGRGEFLTLLKDSGIRARGVDLNAEMAAIARERGLDVVHGDALAFLEALDDDSLGGVIAAQVVEHLDPSYLVKMLDALSRKLRQGSPLVVETINPACWLAFFSSYIRDLTHVRPVHAETLQYLLRAHGFERVGIRYSAPVPAHMKMQTVDLPAEILTSTEASAAALSRAAQTANANATILNNLLFTDLDYAAIGFRS